ncbi:MAG: hypothetical protein ABEJ08_03595 [Halobacteriaceae archaeon]
MDREMRRYLTGITAVLCLLVGLQITGPTADFARRLAGVGIGVLLFIVVFFYQAGGE